MRGTVFFRGHAAQTNKTEANALSNDSWGVYFSLPVCRHETTPLWRGCQLVAERFLIRFFAQVQPSLKSHLSHCCDSSVAFRSIHQNVRFSLGNLKCLINAQFSPLTERLMLLSVKSVLHASGCFWLEPFTLSLSPCMCYFFVFACVPRWFNHLFYFSVISALHTGNPLPCRWGPPHVPPH